MWKSHWTFINILHEVNGSINLDFSGASLHSFTSLSSFIRQLVLSIITHEEASNSLISFSDDLQSWKWMVWIYLTLENIRIMTKLLKVIKTCQNNFSLITLKFTIKKSCNFLKFWFSQDLSKVIKILPKIQIAVTQFMARTGELSALTISWVAVWSEPDPILIVFHFKTSQTRQTESALTNSTWIRKLHFSSVSCTYGRTG